MNLHADAVQRSYGRGTLLLRFIDISNSYDICPERSQGQLRNFKELFAERNTYDRDAPYAADYEIAKSHPPSVHNKPDNINQERNRPAAVYYFSSERPE